MEEPRKRSRGRLAMVLTVALFGATTAAAAITASSRNCARCRSCGSKANRPFC